MYVNRTTFAGSEREAEVGGEGVLEGHFLSRYYLITFYGCLSYLRFVRISEID